MAHTDTTLIVGVLSELSSREHRVALDPSAVDHLVKAGFAVLFEAGCGADASFPDSAYEASGATAASHSDVIAKCNILAVLDFPAPLVADALTSGQVLVGLLDALNNRDAVAKLASRGVTAVALELLPRTLSRAQAMDALSSQSSAAGYRAGIVAASSFGRYLPMMVTASGTAIPAKVIVIGTGVAGLQAIATTKRLGAIVTGYDVRPASHTEVESLGARFLTSSVAAGAGEGGYARAMTTEEQAAQQNELSEALIAFDVIITTAKVPGRMPALLVSEQALATLQPGSVCVDLGASDKGGNVFGSVDGETHTTAGGVIVVGGGNLAADLPASASQMYGRNITSVIDALAPDGVITIDATDEVHSAIVVSHDGLIVSERVRDAMKLAPLPAPDAHITSPKAKAA
ncbi:NAD(P) transhydrogenase subunit alpha [Microbacterium endophyticum]|uniref:proton-translocating NAD(P)(+) transhydrogenase n=1 Tax=Microbacterium endophyticum TaxID=1526412 RepID=A0A7W4YM57_9MICO|nr:NAD(P) transhydrogenase subunit alpha [Microbacterium endophyticum]MBB2975174.1 NAD(P) transhydrogenase subunit alpha [Microbacterium endophyticum]NIK37614.1 NAD(P) transhydrogenase subunit alpha [Microbacterium endophyticum]